MWLIFFFILSLFISVYIFVMFLQFSFDVIFICFVFYFCKEVFESGDWGVW